jgi:hypothetical protein
LWPAPNINRRLLSVICAVPKHAIDATETE